LEADDSREPARVRSINSRNSGSAMKCTPKRSAESGSSSRARWRTSATVEAANGFGAGFGARFGMIFAIPGLAVGKRESLAGDRDKV